MLAAAQYFNIIPSPPFVPFLTLDELNGQVVMNGYPVSP